MAKRSTLPPDPPESPPDEEGGVAVAEAPPAEPIAPAESATAEPPPAPETPAPAPSDNSAAPTAAPNAPTGDAPAPDAPAPETPAPTPEAAPTAAATPAPAPTGDFAQLSDSDKAFLKKHSAIEQAFHFVQVAKEDLAVADLKLAEAKTVQKAKETALEAARNGLEIAIAGSSAENRPLPLYDTVNSTEPAPAHYPALALTAAPAPAPDTNPIEAWNKKWESFLSQSINALDVSDAIKEKLREHSSPVTTLRSLTKLKETDPVKGYSSVKGIADGKATKLENAYDALLQAFLAENPNPDPSAAAPRPQAAPAAADGPVADTDAIVDFETIFPPAVNPTPNESYSADYHTTVIAEAVAELKEIGSLKALLAGPESAAMSKRQRKEYEKKLGENQLQYDQGIDIYADKFGKSAAEALERHVRARVERQSQLKGGLE